jgi:hypothetical protein
MHDRNEANRLLPCGLLERDVSTFVMPVNSNALRQRCNMSDRMIVAVTIRRKRSTRNILPSMKDQVHSLL